MSYDSAQLKGSLFPLSVLQLEDNDLQKLGRQLELKYNQAPSFFFRAPVVVNIEHLADQPIDFAALKQQVEQQNFICVGICNGTNEQKKQARTAGLAALSQPKPAPAAAPAPKKEAEEPAPPKEEPVASKQEQEGASEQITVTPPPEAPKCKIVRQNIRSGQQIYAKGGDLVIMGSVGNGAEVIADGSIHIYGSLRGRAIAGAQGNRHSAIFCQHLEAELVSVAGTYWLSEAIQETNWQQACLVKLEEDQLIIEKLL